MMVLVADDDERLRAAIGIILKKAGYQVCEAGNGIQALSAFDEKRPDIAILDVMMPKLDGFEVCEIIRKSRARTPVLFLTAKSDIADKKSGFSSCASRRSSDGPRPTERARPAPGARRPCARSEASG